MEPGIFEEFGSRGTRGIGVDEDALEEAEGERVRGEDACQASRGGGGGGRRD